MYAGFRGQQGGTRLCTMCKKFWNVVLVAWMLACTRAATSVQAHCCWQMLRMLLAGPEPSCDQP